MNIHLLIDLDGTLVDSCEGIFHAYQKVCAKLGLCVPVLEEFRRKIGPPIDEIYSNFNPDSSKEERDMFRRLFRKIYDSEGYKQYKSYDGVISTIKKLHERQHVDLTIITNKPTKPAKDIVADMNLSTIFSDVIGQDYLRVTKDGEAFKGKTNAINYVTQKIPREPTKYIYIGDTISDYDCAKKAGIDFIAATYGYHKWEQSNIRKIKHINSFSEILELANFL